jgi:hypothetical protein
MNLQKMEYEGACCIHVVQYVVKRLFFGKKTVLNHRIP